MVQSKRWWSPRLRIGRFAVLGLAVALSTAVAAPAAAQILPGVGSAEAEPPAAAGPGTGQAAPDLATVLGTLPEGLTPEQIDAIVAVLDDNQARQALRSSLELLSQQADQAAAVAPSRLALLRQGLAEMAVAAADLPAILAAAIDRDAALGHDSRLWRFTMAVAVYVLVGLAAMAGFARLTRGVRARLGAATGATAGAAAGSATGAAAPRLVRSAVRLLFDVAAIAVFALALVLFFAVMAPVHPRAPAMLQAVLVTLCAAFATAAAARFLLAPADAALRWLRIGDRGARAAYRSILVVLWVSVPVALLVTYAHVMELPTAAIALFRALLTTVTTGVFIAVVWVYRRLLARLPVGDGATPATADMLAVVLPVIATLCLLAVWVLSFVELVTSARVVAGPAALSLAIIFAVPLVARYIQDALVGGAGHPETVARSAADGPAADAADTADTADGAPADAGAPQTPKLMRAVWLVLVLGAVYAVLRVWGIDLTRGEGVGAVLARIAFQAGVVLVLGYVGWLFLRGWFDRRMRAAEAAPQESSMGRMATLLPLIKNFVLTVIATMVFLVVLSSFGINIGPLLAGAGVVGLAIGFGAQSLVADVVSGVFFLLDDAFRVGEYIEVGEIRGTVEGISLRSLRLRHHRGAVHTLAFGQIKTLTNYSRDWVIMKLEFRVSPDTDLALVKRLVKQIGKELAADEMLAPGFLEPLKSQGVRRVEDDALIIGVKFMAKPGTQFTIRKEAYARINQAFHENGIEFAAKGVAVRIEGGADAPPQAVAAAAGKAMLDQAQPPAGG